MAHNRLVSRICALAILLLSLTIPLLGQGGQIDMPSSAPPSRPLPPPPPAAPPPPSLPLSFPASPSSGVEVRVCNHSNEEANVAIGYKLADEWMAEGWWRVGSGDCKTTLRSVFGAIYAYAEGRDSGAVWRGAEHVAEFCVDVRDAFTNPDSRCKANAHADYQWKKFGKLKAPGSGVFIWQIED